MQFGSAWWFLDQLDGMEKQIDALSNMGLLSRFVGMLTDSRSFLSYSRHEYFRRLLCNLLGEDVKRGLLPDDRALLGGLVANVCFSNAKRLLPVRRLGRGGRRRMTGLSVKPATACRFDLVSLGEVMLRLDPGELRITPARFTCWKAARSTTSRVVCVVASAPHGDRHRAGGQPGRAFGRRHDAARGVDLSYLRWAKYDGVGRQVRNGLNFIERGFGPPRPSAAPTAGTPHRAESSRAPSIGKCSSGRRPRGALVSHRGHVRRALREQPKVAERRCDCAKTRHKVSYDLNYRDSLWRSIGGKQGPGRQPGADAARRCALRQRGRLLGGAGFQLEGVDEKFKELPTAAFRQLIHRSSRVPQHHHGRQRCEPRALPT